MDQQHGVYVESARAGDPVSLTQLLVSVPSVNPDLSPGGDGEVRMAEVAAELLSSWGFVVEVTEAAPGRPNVIARLDGTGPTLLLNGHLDTVGVGGMTVDPWGAVIDGDRLIGRGACDMKGGVASLMAAGCRLASGGDRPNLIIALTADEEYASIGMADLVSGAKPVADLAVVCEPTGLAVMPAHKGFLWLEAEFRGLAAHGSRSDVGIDAIRHAGLFLAALDVYADDLLGRPEHPLLGHGSFHAGTIEGGGAESVYPDYCKLRLERRTLPGERTADALRDFESVLEQLGGRHEDMRGTLRVTLERPGTEVSREHPLVRGLIAAGSESGSPVAVEGMTAWVDAAFLNESGVPAVCYGPGSIEQAHTDDEWIAVHEIRKCADVLERFARELARA
jgi:acetylornithine deacetylase